MVSAYLPFLESDMLAHPERMTTLPEDELARLRGLNSGVEAGGNDVIPNDVTL